MHATSAHTEQAAVAVDRDSLSWRKPPPDDYVVCWLEVDQVIVAVESRGVEPTTQED